jgi:hypothetical protein
MSRVFDAFYCKAIRHEWKAPFRAMANLVEDSRSTRPFSEAEETVIQNYNDIWQSAVDFIQDKLDSLPQNAAETDRWFMEAFRGALMDNEIEAEDAKSIPNKTLRQKIDGLASKIDSLSQDAPSGEVAEFITRFSTGLKSFKNRINVDDKTEPPEGGEAPPEGGEAPPEGGEAPPEGGEAPPPDQPPPDENSSSTLLKDLKL